MQLKSKKFQVMGNFIIQKYENTVHVAFKVNRPSQMSPKI